jgi:hypothetical protein
VADRLLAVGERPQVEAGAQQLIQVSASAGLK